MLRFPDDLNKAHLYASWRLAKVTRSNDAALLRRVAKEAAEFAPYYFDVAKAEAAGSAVGAITSTMVRSIHSSTSEDRDMGARNCRCAKQRWRPAFWTAAFAGLTNNGQLNGDSHHVAFNGRRSWVFSEPREVEGLTGQQFLHELRSRLAADSRPFREGPLQEVLRRVEGIVRDRNLDVPEEEPSAEEREDRRSSAAAVSRPFATILQRAALRSSGCGTP